MVLGRVRGRKSAPLMLALGYRWIADGVRGTFSESAYWRAPSLPVHGLDVDLWLGEVWHGVLEVASGSEELERKVAGVPVGL